MSQIVDNKGNVYESIRDFCRKTGCGRRHVLKQLNDKGVYCNTTRGITARKCIDADIKYDVCSDATNNKLLQQIAERYSPEELKLLSRGCGLQDKRMSYPKIQLTGRHHVIGVISDGHLGSKYSPIEFHERAFEEFEKRHCECILHCGDLVEGLNPKRADTQIYELSHIGYKEQKNLAVDVFSRCDIPMYVISGNHDSWYCSMGADIVEEICSEVPNMTYLGYNQADIDVDGATIRLFHGTDGNSYSLSYRLQKLSEAYTGGKKPNILLAGHTHKMCYIFDRMIHCVSVPSLQMQTAWMASKKLAAHTGFLIIEFDTNANGVCNFQFKYYPFYA
jgi:predicted phosphodiesterase